MTEPARSVDFRLRIWDAFARFVVYEFPAWGQGGKACAFGADDQGATR